MRTAVHRLRHIRKSIEVPGLPGTALVVVALCLVARGAELDTSMLPAPVFAEEPGYVDLYWKAWELAWEKIREDEGMPQSTFLHSGRDPEKISLWESCFTALFTKYAPDVFPGIQSLDNFYAMIHDGEDGTLRVEYPDNPPILAWAEWEHFKLTGDTARLKWLIQDNEYLQKHFEYFHNRHAVWDQWQKTYGWSPGASGMINTPRLRKMPEKHEDVCEGGGHDWTCRAPKTRYSDGTDFRWADATMQQCLAARCIREIAGAIEATTVEEEYEGRYAEWAEAMNSGNYRWETFDYWDTRGALVDGGGTKPVKPRTVDRFWVLLSGAPDSARGTEMTDFYLRPNLFGGPVPFQAVNLADIDADFDGRLWRGSMFPAMAYMAVKGIAKYGFEERADELAHRVVEHMYRTFEQFEPHTIWEAYSPTQRKPATDTNGVDLVKGDYCGWSGVGPISLFIEHVLGFHSINATSRRVEWRLHHAGKHGIKRLSFGPVVTDIVFEEGMVSATTNESYTLAINGEEHEITAGEPVSFAAEPLSVRDSLPRPVRLPLGKGVRVEAEGELDYPISKEESEGYAGYLCHIPWRFICGCSQGWKIWVDNNSELPPVPRGSALLMRLAYGGAETNPVRANLVINGEKFTTLEGTNTDWMYVLLRDVPLTEESNTVVVEKTTVNYMSIDFVEVLREEDLGAREPKRQIVPTGRVLMPGVNGALVLSIAESGPAAVDVLDVSGRHLARLAAGYLRAGTHRFVLPDKLRNVHGVHIVRVQTARSTRTGMLVPGK